VRTLLTGVTGQVGAALLRRLGPDTVIAADRGLIDLAFPDRIAPALDRLRPELIVNPAAYTAVDSAEDERDLAFTVNAEAPGAMARWAAAHNVPFIHFSTDYVFDGSGDSPHAENAECRPLSVYGASKLAGERAVQTAGGVHLVVRTSWVYAASGTNFLRTIARLARERDELRIVADQVGAPTSAACIADGVAHIVSQQDTLPARFAAAEGVVHLAAKGQASWFEFASAIIAGLGHRNVALALKNLTPIRSSEYPTKAARPLNSRLNLTRLQTVFGFRPPAWTTCLEAELDTLAREMR
jgi:dTDP-4-dehydrorhamnose reductase